MWAFFWVSVAVAVAAVVYMLAVLPAKGVATQVKVVTGVAWVTTLLVCCIVPIDVYSTLASKNPKGIEVLWDVAFWSTQLLTWLFIPVYMGYADAGEFTWKGRMIASLKANGFFSLVLAIVGAAGLAWAVASNTLSLSTLPSLGIQLSNSFGLFCVLTLLGYGLVAIPKKLWKRSYPQRELRHQLYRLGRVMEEKAEAQGLLEASLQKISSTKRALGNGEVEEHQHIDTMLSFIRNHLGIDPSAAASIGSVEQGVQYTDELPKLHKEIKRDVSWVGAIEKRAEITIADACHLMRVVKASQGSTDAIAAATSLGLQDNVWTRLKWNCSVFVMPWVFRALAVATAALGAVILWGEVTVGFNENLSPLSHLVLAFDTEFTSQLMVMLPLVYVCCATFEAFFAINVGSLYALLPFSTSAFSLLSNANLVCRFAAPLCFNYLHVLSMDRPTKNGYYTVFAQRMGLSQGANVAIPFLGVNFNRWAPWIIILVVGLAMMDAFDKAYLWVATRIPFIPDPYDERDQDEASESNQYVAEGRRIVNRALQESAGGLEVGLETRPAHTLPCYVGQRIVHKIGQPSVCASSTDGSANSQSLSNAPLLD